MEQRLLVEVDAIDARHAMIKQQARINLCLPTRCETCARSCGKCAQSCSVAFARARQPSTRYRHVSGWGIPIPTPARACLYFDRLLQERHHITHINESWQRLRAPTNPACCRISTRLLVRTLLKVNGLAGVVDNRVWFVYDAEGKIVRSFAGPGRDTFLNRLHHPAYCVRPWTTVGRGCS